MIFMPFPIEFRGLKKNALQTDRQMDGRTDGRTDPLIDMVGRIWGPWW